jgi:hypothetical protein
MTNIKTILDSLTKVQAQEWAATTEKYLFVDYEIVSEFNISLNDLPNNNLIDQIEARFTQLLKD